jgi:predicted DNA-binding WGR domain protein
VSGDTTTVTFGKSDTSGQKASKKHKNADAAMAFMTKLKEEKLKKGYKEAGGKKGAAKAAAKAGAKAAAKSAAESSGAKRKAEAESASAPALKKGKSSELLEKAKSAASGGATKKAGGGNRAVDSRAPGAEKLKVHGEYSVKLNQTHIDANNNKFYIIQVLEGDGKFYAWTRWGRVGEPGQNKMVPSSTVDGAIANFKSKFREKTSNNWDGRDNFKSVNGKYTLVETDEGSGGQEDAPMGKLTEAQIGKGQKVLEKLGAEVQKAKAEVKTLEVLSSEFYSLIPHNFGRTRPPAIKTDDMVQKEVELLKFYLRMGFEEVAEEDTLGPIDGVMNQKCPASLSEAASNVCKKADIDKCTKKGDELAKKQVGKPVKKMGAELYGAIMLYTSNAIYKELNQCLRDENRASIKRFFKYLRLFFESMDHLPKVKKTLWRGLSVDLFDNPQYAVGSVVTWWGVSSCTADINVAKNFAKGCGGKCTVITVESLTASDISEITFYANEKESLLCPGTQLKVKSKKRNGNVTEITLAECGRAIG